MDLECEASLLYNKMVYVGHGAHISSVVEYLPGVSKLPQGSIPNTTKLVLKRIYTGKYT